MSIGAIIFTAFNFSQAAIRKVELLCFVVNSESIRSEHIYTNDHFYIVPSQCGAHDAWPLLVPVSPEH